MVKVRSAKSRPRPASNHRFAANDPGKDHGSRHCERVLRIVIQVWYDKRRSQRRYFRRPARDVEFKETWRPLCRASGAACEDEPLLQGRLCSEVD